MPSPSSPPHLFSGPTRRPRFAAALVAGLLLLTFRPAGARAQATGGGSVGSNGSGYIDNAIPGTQLRFRYDTANNLRQPNRAEFFWAQGKPNGPGLPRPERSVDYQELMGYAEFAWSDQARFSTFFEVPGRFINPDINANAAGLGDVNAGFKYALIRAEELVLTAQLRVYAPSGAASRGLGTRHVTLEPALLFFGPLNERWALQGEVRYWTTAGGTDFAGDIIRYGVGAQYDLFQDGAFRVMPVAEVVGWAVLSGKEAFLGPADRPVLQPAAGNGILNALLGVRMGLIPGADLYAGYGRPFTGDRWYENIFRLEFRLTF